MATRQPWMTDDEWAEELRFRAYLCARYQRGEGSLMVQQFAAAANAVCALLLTIWNALPVIARIAPRFDANVRASLRPLPIPYCDET